MSSSRPSLLPSFFHATRRTRDAALRTMAITAAAAIAITGAGIAIGPAHAANSGFSNSFEASEAQPLQNTPLTPSMTVTGEQLEAGSLMGHVTAASASAENAPNEVAASLIDGNAASKWLAFESSATITYQLDAPATMRKFSLTSANDAPGRDPKAFTIEGSTDGKAWQKVDEQSDVSFAKRGLIKHFDAATPGEYSWYRLSISKNAGDSLTQLADWMLYDGSTAQPAASPMVTAVGNGPASGYNIRSTVGFSGTKALRYAGQHIGSGAASATNVLWQDVNLAVTSNTQFSYKIFPELMGDTTYPSTFAAVELQLSDGSLVSATSGITDENGNRTSARSQGESKALFADQWNSVKISLGALAGKTVDRILLSYDNPTASSNDATRFGGWVDDVRIDTSATRIDSSSLVNFVDTRRGTQSSGSFSRGNNIPAATLPNGFNFWTPMTDAQSDTWQYTWAQQNNSANLPMLRGLGISHEPSPWMGDRNQLAIMPATASTSPDAGLNARALAFDHNNEVARPDLYSVKTESGVVAEVTPTDHAAILRFAFPAESGSVMFDKVSKNERASIQVASDGRVTGWSEGGSGLSVGSTRMYFAGQFDRSPSTVGKAAGDRASAQYASFAGLGDAKTVELRLATSFISLDQAQHNADLEVTGRSFDAVQKAAEKTWNDKLGVISVSQSDASDSQLQALYGSLYRLNMYPNSQFENVGSASSPVYKHASPAVKPQGTASDTVSNAVVKDGKIYVNNGFWDTYRTVWPAYSLLYPKMANELVDGFVQHYRDGGWSPRWSSPGYADLMTGTSSDVSFAYAYLSGAIDSKTALDAFDAGYKDATTVSTDVAGAGRKALDQSAFLGYVPATQGESVSWGLEGTINDYGLAKMAKKLLADPKTPKSRIADLTEAEKYLTERSKDYVNLFDSDVQFFQARNADGSFQVPAGEFDPAAWGGSFTETDGWNFAFHAPFDAQGLAGLYGGDEKLLAKLKQFYATPESAENYGGYGGQIHEMLEARAVRMGQLGLSNQPSHHIPYMAANAGNPTMTQEVVREATRRLFAGSDIGQGYTGDEDNGEMSSWFVFSSLGFYPLAQGSGDFTIGSPLFEKATLHLESGRDLVITAKGNSASNIYVQSASFNGKTLDRATVPTAALATGGQLTFDMGAQPSSWAVGKTESALGPDMPAEAPKPLIDATTRGFGSATASDGTSIDALTDDESLTAATFTSPTPAITWDSSQGAVAVERYTLTAARSGDSPTAWTLEGSNDGKGWVPLSEVKDAPFSGPLQTRPFSVNKPAAFAHYRLSVTATASGKAPSLSEWELYSDGSKSASDFSVTGMKDLKAEVNKEFSGVLASVTAPAVDASGMTVIVDWRDGSAAEKVIPVRSPLGAWQIPATHTFTTSGLHSVGVSVMAGADVGAVDVPITVSRTAPTLENVLDNVCLGDQGQAANCDYQGKGLSRSSLASHGFVQGQTNAVPGTGLTFDLPAIEPGKPDNVTGNGQEIALPQGDGITKLSVIGTANEKAQQTVATVHFSDGTSAEMPIEFGDWTASVDSPKFGDILVAKSDFRTVGDSGRQDMAAGVFATPAFDVPAGKKAVSITMPVQTGNPSSSGRIHVFAFATDGQRVAKEALQVSPAETLTGVANQEVSGVIATAKGGVIADGKTTATVNWGDGTTLEKADVKTVGGVATVYGTHTFSKAGEFPASVTVDDGVESVLVTTPVNISANHVYTPSLESSAGDGVKAGETIRITGHGYAPGESVQVSLDAGDTSMTATADANGDVSFDITAPEKEGNHAVQGVGAASGASASVTFIVLGESTGPGQPTGPDGTWATTLQLLAHEGTEGTIVGFTGTGFAAGENVTLTLHSDPIRLGETVANGDGVIAGTFVVPSGAAAGNHRVIAEGAVSRTPADAAFRVLSEPRKDTGKPPAQPGSWKGLAYTGASENTGWIAFAAGVLVVIGLGLMATAVIMRRRRGERTLS